MSAVLRDDVILSKQRWEGLHKKESLGRSIEGDPTIQSYYRFLSKYKNDFVKGTFLDLGCGVAWVASLLAREGVKIVGIDISREAVAKSKRLFQDQRVSGRFVRGDLLDLPFRDNTFSFVWSCMSLEYVRDTTRAIREAYRVLKPGGRIVAVVPVVSFTTLTYHQLRGDLPNIPLLKQFMEWFHLKLMRGKFMAYGYEQSFTPRQLRRLFEAAGFGVNTTSYFPMYYPVAFVPAVIRPLVQSLLAFRLFWPLVYVDAVKKL